MNQGTTIIQTSFQEEAKEVLKVQTQVDEKAEENNRDEIIEEGQPGKISLV